MSDVNKTHLFGSEKDTSNYRECKIEGTVNVPFNDETYINSYEDTVKLLIYEQVGHGKER